MEPEPYPPNLEKGVSYVLYVVVLCIIYLLCFTILTSIKLELEFRSLQKKTIFNTSILRIKNNKNTMHDSYHTRSTFSYAEEEMCAVCSAFLFVFVQRIHSQYTVRDYRSEVVPVVQCLRWAGGACARSLDALPAQASFFFFLLLSIEELLRADAKSN